MTIRPGGETGELVALVRERRLAAFMDRARNLPAADLADVLIELPERERSELLDQLPPRLAATALAEMPRESHPELILLAIDPGLAARLLAELQDDEAASLVGRIPASQRHAIMALLSDRSALDELLRHGAGTAGSLMTARLVAVGELDTITLATEAVRRQAQLLGDVTEIFVVDTARRLCGVLSIKQLLLAPPVSLVRDVMIPRVLHVAPSEEQELVARVIARYGLASVPVVDGTGRLLGRVTADDLHDVALGEVTEDLLRFGGVAARPGLDAGWREMVRGRLPALYASLLVGFGGAAVIFFFNDALVRIATLAVWLPMVGGVGGNAGTQALAVALRHLVVAPLRTERLVVVVRREALVGLANGAAIGVVVAAVALLLGVPWKLGLAVFLAMVGNLVVAGIVGGGVPLVLKRIGRDPALASPVMLTALIDACGFALLLILASAMIR